MTNQGRTVQELETLRKDLEKIVESLKTVHEPQSRILLMEQFKRQLEELRKGVLAL